MWFVAAEALSSTVVNCDQPPVMIDEMQTGMVEPAPPPAPVADIHCVNINIPPLHATGTMLRGAVAITEMWPAP